MNLIGLGNVGCAVVSRLKRYPEYRVYQINTELDGLKKDGYFNFPKCAGPDQYEGSCPSMKNFFKHVSGDTVFVVSGSEYISAASLKILEAIKSKATISVLYYREDAGTNTKIKKAMDNVAFNVFQEYARSGVFKQLYIVSQDLLSTAIGDVSLLDFRSKTIEALTSMFHMINILKHSAPLYDNYSEPLSVARISTIGTASLNSNVESLLYPIELTREKTYLYLIPSAVLAEDTTLIKKIHENVKNNSNDGKIKINFGVYESSYDDPVVYVVSSSSMIQGRDRPE